MSKKIRITYKTGQRKNAENSAKKLVDQGINVELIEIPEKKNFDSHRLHDTVFLPKTRLAIDNSTLSEKNKWIFGSRLTDLSHKYHFFTLSREYFLKNLSHTKKCWERNEVPLHLMDTYYYFEAFLYHSRAFLDHLTILYIKLISSKQKPARKSFRKYRDWVLKNGTTTNYDEAITKYLSYNTEWFKLLKEYRDMVAHRQGYNPAVVINSRGLLELDICIINDRDQLIEVSEKKTILFQTITIIIEGLNDLINFSDQQLSKSLVLINK